MKFTIRDLFLVTVIVALAVGWWLDRRQLSMEILCLKNGHWEFSVARGSVFVPASREEIEALGIDR